MTEIVFKILPYLIGGGIGAALINAIQKVIVKGMDLRDAREQFLIKEVSDLRGEVKKLTNEYLDELKKRASIEIQLGKALAKLKELEDKIEKMQKNGNGN